MAAVHSASSHVRPPPLTQSDAVTSLLSLGLAAAGNDNPAPIPISSVTSTSSISSSTPNGALSLPQTTTTLGTSLGSSTIIGTSSNGNGKHHRRLGSTGKTRRRLSDAREASTRPLTQHSLLSLASLSLSTSPGALSSKPLAPRPTPDSTTTPSGITISSNSTTPTAISVTLSSSVSETTVKPESLDNDRVGSNKTSSGGSTPIPITANSKQKKRGVDYKCESCAKIYRHPNCLNKHRWEHTRQWREASKFVLSKHQQVQLLEAAAILSYMGAPSTSLPEDRSEWPSFLSGGSLPKVYPAGGSKDRATSVSVGSLNSSNTVGNGGTKDSLTIQPTRLNPLSLSTSVPVRMLASGAHGPRMHDFTLPASTSTGVGIGVVGPSPNSFAQGRGPITANGGNFPAMSNAGGLLVRSVTPISSSLSGMMMDHPGWVSSHIPSSSIRSESSARSGSRSRSGSLSGSRSRSRSDGSELEPEIEREQDIDVDVEIMDADADMGEDEKAFGVHDSMSRTKGYPASVISSRPTEAVLVPFNVSAYPDESYGSSYGRHSVIQGGREIGSFTSSSYGTANAGNGTPGFGGFSNRVYALGNAPYPGGINTKPTEHYGNIDYSSPSRALRGSGTMSQREAERMSMRPIVKAEVEETMTRNVNDNYARRWDGMEMEVDMDMD